MAWHRGAVNNPKNQHRPLYAKLKELGFENFYIELIETYPCSNSEELKKREGHFIREVGTLNKLVAGHTWKEHYEANLEKRLEYLEINRENIRAVQKEYREKKP